MDFKEKKDALECGTLSNKSNRKKEVQKNNNKTKTVEQTDTKNLNHEPDSKNNGSTFLFNESFESMFDDIFQERYTKAYQMLPKTSNISPKKRKFFKRKCQTDTLLSAASASAGDNCAEDVSKVLKIISKPDVLSQCSDFRPSTNKPSLKTYGKLQNSSGPTCNESFALPDLPIASSNAKTTVVDNLDVGVLDVEEITLLDLQHCNESWKVDNFCPISDELRIKVKPVQHNINYTGFNLDSPEKSYEKVDIISSDPSKVISFNKNKFDCLPICSTPKKRSDAGVEINIQGIRDNFKKMLNRNDRKICENEEKKGTTTNKKSKNILSKSTTNMEKKRFLRNCYSEPKPPSTNNMRKLRSGTKEFNLNQTFDANLINPSTSKNKKGFLHSKDLFGTQKQSKRSYLLRNKLLNKTKNSNQVFDQLPQKKDINLKKNLILHKKKAPELRVVLNPLAKSILDKFTPKQITTPNSDGISVLPKLFSLEPKMVPSQNSSIPTIQSLNLKQCQTAEVLSYKPRKNRLKSTRSDPNDPNHIVSPDKSFKEIVSPRRLTRLSYNKVITESTLCENIEKNQVKDKNAGKKMSDSFNSFLNENPISILNENEHKDTKKQNLGMVSEDLAPKDIETFSQNLVGNGSDNDIFIENKISTINVLSKKTNDNKKENVKERQTVKATLNSQNDKLSEKTTEASTFAQEQEIMDPVRKKKGRPRKFKNRNKELNSSQESVENSFVVNSCQTSVENSSFLSIEQSNNVLIESDAICAQKLTSSFSETITEYKEDLLPDNDEKNRSKMLLEKKPKHVSKDELVVKNRSRKLTNRNEEEINSSQKSLKKTLAINSTQESNDNSSLLSVGETGILKENVDIVPRKLRSSLSDVVLDYEQDLITENKEKYNSKLLCEKEPENISKSELCLGNEPNHITNQNKEEFNYSRESIEHSLAINSSQTSVDNSSLLIKDSNKDNVLLIENDDVSPRKLRSFFSENNLNLEENVVTEDDVKNKMAIPGKILFENEPENIFNSELVIRKQSKKLANRNKEKLKFSQKSVEELVLNLSQESVDNSSTKKNGSLIENVDTKSQKLESSFSEETVDCNKDFMTESNDKNKLKTMFENKLENISRSDFAVRKRRRPRKGVDIETTPNNTEAEILSEHVKEIDALISQNTLKETINLAQNGILETKSLKKRGRPKKIVATTETEEIKEEKEDIVNVKDGNALENKNNEITVIKDINSSKCVEEICIDNIAKEEPLDELKAAQDSYHNSVSKNKIQDLEPGDIAWAQIGKFPYWPCIVTEDNETGIYKQEIENQKSRIKYHVRFLGDKGRRCWVKNQNVLPYKNFPNFNILALLCHKEKRSFFKIRNNDRNKWQKAVNEAVLLNTKTLQEKNAFIISVMEESRFKANLKRKRKSSFNTDSESIVSIKSEETTPNEKKIKLNEDEESALKQSKENVNESKIPTTLEDKGKTNLKEPSELNGDKSVENNEIQKTDDQRDEKDVLMKKSLDSNPTAENISDNANLLDETKVKAQPDDLLEIESKTSSISIEITSELYSIAFQKALFKRNNLFKGISREKVCQYCLTNGDVQKCKGKCNGNYHLDCAAQIVKEPVYKKKMKHEQILLNGSFDEPFQKEIERDKKGDDLGSKNIMKTSNKDEHVQIITIGSSRMKSPPKRIFPPNFKEMTLAEQIDYKMKEIMKKFETKTTYFESDSSLSSDESKEVKGNGKADFKKNLNQSKVSEKAPTLKKPIKHVTADFDINGVSPQRADHSNASKAKEFKCGHCSSDLEPLCFVCEKESSTRGSSTRRKCSLYQCGRFYHPDCLKAWPQTQWSLSHEEDSFVCPLHVCHTCVSDNPRAATSRCSADKTVKCLRCPSTYHATSFCVPAGSRILSTTQIVCPKHRTKTYTINTTWCFLCSEGGSLVCCETCPTSVHPECLPVNLTDDDKFICEDCESGRLPLYDEIVWVKLGKFRWWPALVMFPSEVPDKVRNAKHEAGEFVVRFFGTYDYYWVSRGRSFLFQEGDTACSTQVRKKVDVNFSVAVEEAIVAHKLKKEFKLSQEIESISMLKPPPYIKIKSNKPVGSVRLLDLDLSSTNACECNPDQHSPCGPDSDCLNRLLMTECNPEVCPARTRCKNQLFEKREYPPLIPYKTQGRGWGLKTLAPISKGQFIIEYVGELIDMEEYHRRLVKMHKQKEENYYFLTINKDRMVDAGPKGNVSRFMNHCCQPNCETQKWTVNGDTRVGLFATEDIPPNTELTFNYNLECVGKEKKVCMCGAPNCSGFIGVKVRQETDVRKRKRNNKKKQVVEPVKLPPCFICSKNGNVGLCNNKICNKAYHLKCLKLDSWPDGNKFICPWHSCNICSKRTIRCCVKCINSFCPSHSENNIRHDNLLGFICCKHDPIKIEQTEIKQRFQRSTEDIVTSLTNDETQPSDTGLEVISTTSTPLKNCGSAKISLVSQDEQVSSTTLTEDEDSFRILDTKRRARSKSNNRKKIKYSRKQRSCLKETTAEALPISSDPK